MVSQAWDGGSGNNSGSANNSGSVRRPTTRTSRAHRGVHGIEPTMPSRPRVACTERGHGAWLSFRREKVPGTAPIAFLEARTHLSTPRGRLPALQDANA